MKYKANQGGEGSYSFAHVQAPGIPRSQFNRDHGLTTAFDSALLIPVYTDEALPGDTHNLKMTTFCRMATPIFPVLANIFLTSFFFAVPIRLVWENWEKMCGAQDNPGDSTEFLVPQIVSTTGFGLNSLHDYLGLPIDIPALSVSSLWHRAYNLIWNTWFRSEDLDNSITVDTDDGPDALSNYTLQRRRKRHDYFTSALPFVQKGTAVPLPLGDEAKIHVLGGGGGPVVNIYDDGLAAAQDLDSATADLTVGGVATTANQYLYADLSTATGSTINALRESFAIQAIYERDARGGTRYTELIRSHFQVTSSDQRLQRPEYLGGGEERINVHPIPQTSEGTAGNPIGLLGAYGVSSSGNHGFVKSFTEHCVLIGMVSVRSTNLYQEGLERMYSRRTRWDFYWPDLAHLGEQSILNKELVAVGSGGAQTDDGIFGYNERWSEYRYKQSRITGIMRSQATGSIDQWHLAQELGAAVPTLGPSFIQENPPFARVLAVADEPEFLFDAWFQYKVARPMPTYSTPGLMGRF